MTLSVDEATFILRGQIPEGQEVSDVSRTTSGTYEVTFRTRAEIAERKRVSVERRLHRQWQAARKKVRKAVRRAKWKAA